jgi:hypothetical protein
MEKVKIDIDYIFLVLNCEKYREKALKQDWLKSLPSFIRYYHVIGNKTRCDGADISIDEENHILYCNTLDDYNSLPSKVITTMKGVTENFNYKYIFKTDDDQQLIIPDFFMSFTKNLENYIPVCHYGGHIIRIKDHYSQYWTVHSCLPKDLLLKETSYATGRFSFLSKWAVEDLISKKESIEKHVIEDHAIGYNLNPMFKTNMIHFDTRHIFIDHI